MSTQAPTLTSLDRPTPSRADRVRHTVAGVFAQYIQDLTRPVQDLTGPADPVPCLSCP